MRLSVVVTAVCMSIVGLAVADDVHASVKKYLAIPPEELGAALKTLARERGFQIVYVTEDLNGSRTQGARGEFTPEEALRQLLRGTGFTFRFVDDKTVTVVPVASTSGQLSSSSTYSSALSTSDASQQEGRNSSSGTFRVAEATQGQNSQSSSVAQLEGGLPEITVTARKIAENLMQVPTAVSALTASDIQASGVTELNNLAKFTPGLVDTGSATGGKIGGSVSRTTNQLTFRGLSVDSGLIFLDGAPYSSPGRGSGAEPDMTEVARVEVLKGPQSVYFGRSTFSGAVNYVTKDPGNTLEGNVSGDLSSFGGKDIHASLDGPLSDKLGFLVGGRDYSTDGQYDNPLEGNRLGAESTLALQGKLLMKPSDQLQLSGFYSWELDDDGQPAEGVMLARTFTPTATPGIVSSPRTGGTGGELNCNTGGTGGPYFCGQLPSLTTLQKNDPLIISDYNRLDPLADAILIQDVPLPNSALNNAVVSYPNAFHPNWLDHYGSKQLGQTAHLRFDYNMPSGWTLNSIAAWNQAKSEDINDFEFRDGSELPNPFYVSPTATPYLPVDQVHVALTTSIATNFSGEVRVSSPAKEPIRGTLGADYLYMGIPLDAENGFTIQGLLEGNAFHSLSRTSALFGGVYYDFLPRFTLSVEARYQWDDIVQSNVFPTPTADLEHTYPSFSPRVTLDYKYTADSLVYALFSRGYKPGGFNTQVIADVPSVVSQLEADGVHLAYAQEVLNNYEVGLKSTWLNGRVQTVIDGYYDKWENGQIGENVFVTQPNGSQASSGTVVINSGLVTLEGIEAEAHYAPTNQWLISGSMAYMHNIINSFQDFSFGPKIFGSTNADGYTLPGAPEWTFSLSPQYTRHFVGAWDSVTRIDWTYRSRMFLDTHDIAWTAPLSLVNLRSGFTKDKFTVEAYANNLFNNMTIPNAGIGMDVIDQNISANAIRFVAPVMRVIGLNANLAF